MWAGFLKLGKIQGNRIFWRLRLFFFQTGWAGEEGPGEGYRIFVGKTSALLPSWGNHLKTTYAVFALFPWGLSVQKGPFSGEAKHALAANWTSLAYLSCCGNSGKGLLTVRQNWGLGLGAGQWGGRTEPGSPGTGSCGWGFGFVLVWVTLEEAFWSSVQALLSSVSCPSSSEGEASLFTVFWSLRIWAPCVSSIAVCYRKQGNLRQTCVLGGSQIQQKPGTYCLSKEDKLRSIGSHPAKPRRPKPCATGSEAYTYGPQNNKEGYKEFSELRGSKGSCLLLVSQISGKGLPTGLCSHLSSLAGLGEEGDLQLFVVPEDVEVLEAYLFSYLHLFSVTAS